MSDQFKEGKVFLVGAGPGDPRLITLRGQQCLQQADVVLYDYLVNPVLARWAPKRALQICLGKHGEKGRIWTQDEVHQALLSFARQGLYVVRLKGGDPAIFARLAEEVDFLQHNQIPFEIVPGITAALAVSSYAGIPLTHREHASAVALVTGHEDESRAISQLDYGSLARFPGTIVIYMGVTTVCQWVAGLREHGMRGTMPVALVRRCSFPDQSVLRCTLDEVPEKLTPYRKFPPPVIAVIGEVAACEATTSWYLKKPLLGQRILCARPQSSEEVLESLLIDRGALVFQQPAIEIEDATMSPLLEQQLDSIGQADWVVFASPHGVESCMRLLTQLGRDARAFANVRIAAIGPATARKLESYFLRADLIPARFESDSLTQELLASVNQHRTNDVNMSLIQADNSRDALAKALQQSGVEVTSIVTYHIKPVSSPDDATQRMIASRQIDWIVVTSATIAKALSQMFGEHLRDVKIASLSRRISDVLRVLGFAPTVEAAEPDFSSLVEAIANFQTE